jgi:heterodisulfide reductase subunit C
MRENIGSLYERLMTDIHMQEGLNACINCGTCTAICPAAMFYKYDPREIAIIVSSRDDKKIEELLKSDTIWACGECMSCKTRCPRGNAPGLIIIALRTLSEETGFFAESEKGRQLLAIKRMIGHSILDTGYCVWFDHLDLELFPEQGPNWQWIRNNNSSVLDKVGANYRKNSAGALRTIPKEDLDELKKIFEVTGGLKRYDIIEEYSRKKAAEMGLQFDDTNECEYFQHVFAYNSNNLENE